MFEYVPFLTYITLCSSMLSSSYAQHFNDSNTKIISPNKFSLLYVTKHLLAEKINPQVCWTCKCKGNFLHLYVLNFLINIFLPPYILSCCAT